MTNKQALIICSIAFLSLNGCKQEQQTPEPAPVSPEVAEMQRKIAACTMEIESAFEKAKTEYLSSDTVQSLLEFRRLEEQYCLLNFECTYQFVPDEKSTLIKMMEVESCLKPPPLD